METKVPWYPFSLPDYLMLCLIAWFFGGVNPVVNIYQVCKCFHNVGLHLHIMCSIMNASTVFKDKHCDFSKPLCSLFWLNTKSFPCHCLHSIPTVIVLWRASILWKGCSFPKQNQTLSRSRAAVLSVLTLLDHCQGLLIFFPPNNGIFWQSDPHSANPPSSGSPPACWSRSDCFLQPSRFHFKALGKLRKG